MTKDQIRIGGVYLAKVSDKVVPVRIDATSPHGGWDATSQTTGKKVRIKSAQRLRGPAPERDARQHAPGRGPTQAEADALAAAIGHAPANAVSPDVVPLAEAMKPAKGKRGKVASEPKAKRSSGLDAAYQVLTEAGAPMRCGDVVEKMLADGIWKTSGRTPSATIYAAIVREIAARGTASRFKKTDRGMFIAA